LNFIAAFVRADALKASGTLALQSAARVFGNRKNEKVLIFFFQLNPSLL
jgi:hypothetical protein